MEINTIELLSVGVDVGSSTSHLAFSRLLLERDHRSPTRRFEIRNRDIIYEGTIIDTPLVDRDTIDIEKLLAFFREEYRRAGIDPRDIQSGAVIVTERWPKNRMPKRLWRPSPLIRGNLLRRPPARILRA